AIASAISAMAQIRKFQVIAEGVENEAQLDFLRGKGCDLVQGYLFSPAVPAAELLDMLRRQQPPAHAVAWN
ncbi:MAG: EAL domain-containing protein, partial [Pseudomonadota bacterium]